MEGLLELVEISDYRERKWSRRKVFEPSCLDQEVYGEEKNEGK